MASEKHVEKLECLLEEETQAKRDEEIVRNLQARYHDNYIVVKTVNTLNMQKQNMYT